MQATWEAVLGSGVYLWELFAHIPLSYPKSLKSKPLEAKWAAYHTDFLVIRQMLKDLVAITNGNNALAKHYPKFVAEFPSYPAGVIDDIGTALSKCPDHTISHSFVAIGINVLAPLGKSPVIKDVPGMPNILCRMLCMLIHENPEHQVTGVPDPYLDEGEKDLLHLLTHAATSL